MNKFKYIAGRNLPKPKHLGEELEAELKKNKESSHLLRKFYTDTTKKRWDFIGNQTTATKDYMEFLEDLVAGIIEGEQIKLSEVLRAIAIEHGAKI